MQPSITAKRPARVLLPCLLLLALSSVGCGHQVIPNTHVEDTKENREILDFCEVYREAVEKRDVTKLLSLASKDYFDDMGTPSGDDDIDYEGLSRGLKRVREEVLAARYQISYRAITRTQDRVLVDLLYTGWFRVETTDGPRWRRRLQPHRLVLTRDEDSYLVLSGM